MPTLQITVHGTSVVAEAVGGANISSPGPLLQVNGVPWTDVVGLRQGWGTTFRGKAGTGNWFHFNIPVHQVREQGFPQSVKAVTVDFAVQGQVRVTSVHLWSAGAGGGGTRIFQRDGLAATSRLDLDTSGHLPVSSLHPLGISIGVSFLEEGQITFFSAGATLDVSSLG